MKFIINDKVGILFVIVLFFIIFILFSSVFFNIGGIIIRKENCVSFVLLLFNNKLVVIVLFEWDNFGNIVYVCVRLMINVFFIEMFFFWCGFV